MYNMKNYYKEIFKRKSFHFFIGGEPTTEEDLKQINEFIKTVEPLYPDIKTEENHRPSWFYETKSFINIGVKFSTKY